MAIDFYVNPLVENASQKENTSRYLEVYNDLDLYIMQLEVLFTTLPGEVLGSPDFGLDLEKYVHELNLTEEDIKKEIRQKCFDWVPLFYNIPTEINIQFIKDSVTYREFMVIDMLILGENAFSVFI